MEGPADDQQQSLLSDTERGISDGSQAPPVVSTERGIPLADAAPSPAGIPRSRVSVHLCCCCCVAPKDHKKEYFPEPRKCTNVLFAVSWAACFFSGLAYFIYLAAAHSSEWSADFKMFTNKYLTDRQRAHIFGILSITVSSCFATIIGMFAFLKFYTHCAIRCALGLVWICLVAITLWLFSIPNLFGGVIMALMCATLPYAVLGKNFRYKFAVTASLIRASSAVIWNRVGLLACAFASIASQIIWALMCGLVFLRINATVKDSQGFAILLSLLFFYYVWTAELIRYTMTYLTSSVVANWACFDSKDADIRAVHVKERGFLAKWPTAAAIRYAFWHNLGVMACAALLVALIQTLRFLIRLMDRDGNGGCEACFIDCILSCIEGQIRYMNNYAITYSAIFGFGFLKSSQQFMDQLENRQGFATIYNDEVTQYIVLGSSLVVASLSAVTAGVFSYSFLGILRADQVVLVAFVFSLFAGLAALQIIAAAVSTLFIINLYEETQRVFMRNHPKSHNELGALLKGAHLEEFKYCSGDGCCCPIICII